MNERILLVDLCGTLYDSNTTFDFLKDFLGGRTDYPAFEASARRLPYRIYNRLMPGDVRRDKAISHLSGFPRENLKTAAHDFLNRLDRIRDVHTFVETERAHYDRTVIVSSSLDFIVESACEVLGFDGWFATTLGYADDECDGRIVDDLLGQKDRIIRREFSGVDCALVTDNHEDLSCRDIVQRFVGVAPAEDRRAMSYWSNRVSEVVAYRN